MEQRKQQKAMYKQTHTHMGIYQIKNKVNQKILVGKSMDLNGAMNRLKFEIRMKSHPNKELQNDMIQYGEQNFSFEVLESIKPEEEIVVDLNELSKYQDKLINLEKKWLEFLQPYDEKGYNKRPKG